MDGQVRPETSVRRLAISIASNYTDSTKLEITNKKKLKTLKNLIRNDQSLVEPLIAGIYSSLKSENPENRIGAVLIANEFFERSGKFREALVDDFQDFLTYSAETDPLGFPIPPPHKTGKALKLLALKTVKRWHEKFGPAYKKLELAYRFLKQNKCLDIEKLEAETEVERRRMRVEEEKKKQLRDRLESKIKVEVDELKPEIKRCQTEMGSALELLYPLFSENNPTLSAAGGSSERFSGVDSTAQILEDLEAHGISGGGSQLEIDITNFKQPEILQSEDNQILIQTLKDNARQIHVSFIPKISKWLRSLAKMGGSEALTKSLIDCKQQLLGYQAKFKDLKLIEADTFAEGASSEDEDLEEVPTKEGMEFGVPENPETLQSHIREFSRKPQNSRNNEQPSTSKASFEPSPDEEESSASSSIRKVSFGLDLKYWGREKEMETPSIVKNNCDSHRFWRPPVEEENSGASNSEAIAYRTRVMTFMGSYKPETRECRAPLPNGKGTCKRQHKSRCPLHGIIKDRNQDGELINIEAEVPEPSTSKSAPQTHWKPDPDLMRDVEAGTGKSLRLKPKKGRGNKKPGREINPRKRLEQKLFDKKALRRVGDTLDAIQKAKARRKHEHQFNYVLSK